MTISKDRVKPSPSPDSWKLSEIFATGVVIGTYLALMTVLFYHLATRSSFFANTFGVIDLSREGNFTPDVLNAKLASAVYLQVSTISQALIFVTRSRGWSFMERPGLLLLAAFILAQLFATVLSAYLSWSFAKVHAIGWAWTGVIWLYNILCYMLLDPIKFAVRYALSGRAWGHVINRKDFGREVREAAWAKDQRTLHGLDTSETKTFAENYTFRDINMMAEEAKHRAEIARLRELHTQGKGRVFCKAKRIRYRCKPTLHCVINVADCMFLLNGSYYNSCTRIRWCRGQLNAQNH